MEGPLYLSMCGVLGGNGDIFLVFQLIKDDILPEVFFAQQQPFLLLLHSRLINTWFLFSTLETWSTNTLENLIAASS
jgi:hypothetical protein